MKFRAYSAAAVVILSACAGGGSSPLSSGIDAAPSSSAANPFVRQLPGVRAALAAADTHATPAKSWSSAKAAEQSVYVVDPGQAGYYGAVCYYGPSGGAQLGCLDGGASSQSGIDFPQGSWIDRNKHLFVANGSSSSGYSGQVTEYDLPLGSSSTPVNTLYSNVTNSSEGAMLGYVCGDSAGNIYGTTIYSTTIAVWKAGTTDSTPTSTLVDSKLQNVGSPALADGPVACATDHMGNLYISGQYATGNSSEGYTYFAELDEFKGGLNGSGKPMVLQKETSDLYFPAGVAIDKQGNLAWALFNLNDSASQVCTYTRPYRGEYTACTSGFATGFHFTKSGKDLWGGDTTVYPWYGQPGLKMANEIAYPGGGLVQSTASTGLVYPVDASVNPPL